MRTRHDRDRRVAVRVTPRTGYVVGALDLPAAGATVTVEAVGEDRAEALQRAALLAERVVNDPVVRAFMGPYVDAGVRTVKTLATAARRGKGVLRGVWKKLRGRGKRRIARALAKETPRSPRIPWREPTEEPAPAPAPADEDPDYDDGDSQ